MQNKRLTYSPLFWVLFLIGSLASGYIAYRYFPQTFPILSVNLQMSREQALTKAQELAAEFNWQPSSHQQAASFAHENDINHYVELEGGGIEALHGLIQENIIAPYHWSVRHFQEQNTNETNVLFKPNGAPYGFVEKLSETEPGAALDKHAAQQIAEQQAKQGWQVDLNNYALAEHAHQIRPSSRIDHTFVYERTDKKIGQAPYRLTLGVSGDRLTQLQHSLKIPESFNRRYTQMRSTNKLLASGAVIAMALLYILGGCVIALVLLLQRNWIIWRWAVVWGFFTALLGLGLTLNQWPLRWMEYDTAIPAHSYRLYFLALLIAQTCAAAALYTLIFAAAEGLTRKAFGKHIQFWKLWHPQAASSWSVLGRTVSGYLLPSFSLAYVVLFYFFALNYLHWWSPAEVLIDPNILATYVPWFSALAMAFTAGFTEECIFRAIPLSCVALIGDRLGRRRLWLTIGFILQAVIFSAAHASYPTQPAYARLVELLIPSFVFGALYLRFGLLVGIISHFVYDAILMALPLFISSTPGIWLQQLFAVLAMLIPLLVVLYYRLLNKSWSILPARFYNFSWQSPAATQQPTKPPKPVLEQTSMGRTIKRIVLLAGLTGMISWGLFTSFVQHDTPLTLSRSEAIAKAHSHLAERGIMLSDRWRPLTSINPAADEQHIFVWRTGGKALFNTLLGSYLAPTSWIVRFARFSGDLQERAEEYRLYLNNGGTLFRFEHIVPEDQSGADLDEDQARHIAKKHLQKLPHVNPKELEEIIAESTKQPQRRDWKFEYRDTSVELPQNGQARIVVMLGGDKVIDQYRYIFVPEEWQRTYRKEQTQFSMIALLCMLLLIFFLCWGWLRAAHNHALTFSYRGLAYIFALLLPKSLVQLYNLWPTFSYALMTAEPLPDQIIQLIGGQATLALFANLVIAVLVVSTLRWQSILGTTLPQRKRVIFGITLGLALAGLSAIMSAYGTARLPTWADYSLLNAYSTIVNIIAQTATSYVLVTSLTLMFFGIIDEQTHGWHTNQRRWLGFIILLGILLRGMTIAETGTVAGWLLSGILVGLLCTVAYTFVIRFDRGILPIVTATTASIALITNAARSQSSPYVIGTVGTLLVLAFLSVVWSNFLEQQGQRGDSPT